MCNLRFSRVYLMQVILLHSTPAIKYVNTVIPAKAGHAVKLMRYPGQYWMPEHVRHDALGYLVARLIVATQSRFIKSWNTILFLEAKGNTTIVLITFDIHLVGRVFKT